ncbi:MAG: type I methionyl aminopeptidase [Bacteroidia bacterium]|nr:type I methionyl aminopeptidase [Bacteroidia bacterium]MDW8089674.1 type I methionyl aminopeptidase [Bacteroidia bacterium]
MKYDGWAIHTEQEIQIIAEAAKILSRLFGHLVPFLRPGISTAELDQIAEEFIRREGAEPAFKDYQPPFEDRKYPYTLCVSIDSEVVHGLPSPQRILQAGQIVSVDCGVRLAGLHADMAYTFAIGAVPPSVQRLLWVTEQALLRGIAQAKAGAALGDIGHAIHSFVKNYTFAVADNLTGHGVGRAMHMPPDVPNTGQRGKGPRLPERLVIAIEPMVHMGKRATCKGVDGWVVCTRDGSLAAHYEHTVVVGRNAPRVLTSFDPIYKALAHV